MRQRLFFILLFAAAIALVPLAARGELPAGTALVSTVNV